MIRAEDLDVNYFPEFENSAFPVGRLVTTQTDDSARFVPLSNY
jgi:hypothetical protein